MKERGRLPSVLIKHLLIKTQENFYNNVIISYFKLFLRPYTTLFFKPATSIQCPATLKLYLSTIGSKFVPLAKLPYSKSSGATPNDHQILKGTELDPQPPLH